MDSSFQEPRPKDFADHRRHLGSAIFVATLFNS